MRHGPVTQGTVTQGTVTEGTVTEFDEPRGLGTVTASDGTRFPFHCIEIADGTRTIDVGRRVSFRPIARFGRFQAGEVRAI